MHGPVERTQQGAFASARWGDLPLRIISALLLTPVALLSVWAGGPVWDGVCCLMTLGVLLEWMQLCGWTPRRAPGGPLVLAFVLAWGAAMFGWAPALFDLALFAALVGLLLVRPGLGLGLVYIALSCWGLIWLRARPAGFNNLLLLFFTIWASDVGAYLVGRLVGGAKLAPAISPGKTWSGAFGGIATAAAFATLIAGLLGAEPARAAPVGALLSVAAQFGDLGESWAKRHFKVKDSGHLIPGHGGLFDRLDGLIAASFVAVVLALLASPAKEFWR